MSNVTSLDLSGF
ncbi:hypothetical protein LOS20_06535 [Enterococcus faecium]|nr:hypothetical protein [Enterococcus faecium]